MASEMLQLQLRSISYEASSIVSFELRSANGVEHNKSDTGSASPLHS